MVPTPGSTSRPLLAEISADQRRAVVRRVIGKSPVVAPLEVAAFSSSI